MVIIVLENVSPSLRGELTRWLIEPRAGVFIGHISAMVRDRLWEKCTRDLKKGGALLAWSTNNEQRYKMQMAGDLRREVVDFEGLQLIRATHVQKPDK